MSLVPTDNVPLTNKGAKAAFGPSQKEHKDL